MTSILLPRSFCVGCQKWPEETPRTLSLQNLSQLEMGRGFGPLSRGLCSSLVH